MGRNKVMAVAVAAVLLAACGSSGSSNSSNGGSATPGGAGTAASGTVTIANVQGQTWTCGFNPFNPAVNTLSVGPVYEPLVYVNALKNQEATPMLASAFEWSADKTTLTFTIRDGVKWSDGQP